MKEEQSEQTELPIADYSGHDTAVEDLLADRFLTVSPLSEDFVMYCISSLCIKWKSASSAIFLTLTAEVSSSQRGRYHYSTLTANTQRQTADRSCNTTMDTTNTTVTSPAASVLLLLLLRFDAQRALLPLWCHQLVRRPNYGLTGVTLERNRTRKYYTEFIQQSCTSQVL